MSSIRFLGHATVLVDLAGTHVLTDPILTERVMFIRRVAEAISELPATPSAVLVSHAHHDHLHQPSLSLLSHEMPIYVPSGLGALVRRWGLTTVTELSAGDEVVVGDLRIAAVRAVHSGRREPAGPTAEALGFIVTGAGRTIYFAGDTDLFDGMRELGDRGIDVALLPVWGWGPRLGSGHLNPETAAEAVALLRPAVTIPIHWGTLWPVAMPWRRNRLVDPPIRLVDEVRRRGLEARIEVLDPGAAFDLDEMRRMAA